MFIHSAPIISETVSAAAVLILLLVFSAVLLPCFLRKRFFSGNSAAEYKGRIKTAGILLLLMAALTSAVSAEGETGITLGSGAINTGNNVYFGNILWRVLYGGTGEDDLDVTNAGKALLISNDILASTQFNPDNTVPNANVWRGSNAQTWCNSYYKNWSSGVEKDAILATTVNEENNEQGYFYQGGYSNDYSYGAAPLNGEHFFFLSAKEADKLFANDNDRKVTGNNYWWLRSPNANFSYAAGSVDGDGWVIGRDVSRGDGARPAFNFNLTSVLFTSEISQSSNQYKLTLKDPNLSISVTNGTVVTRNDSTVTIPYTISGTNSGTETKAYVMVTDKVYTESGASVLYYSELTTGSTGTLTIDSSWGTDYKVYLLAVNKGGENKTDTASAPVEITIPTKSDQTVTAPTAVSNLTYNGSAQTLISTGTAENGTMKYAVTTENTKPADTAYTYTNSSLPTGTDAKRYYVWYMSTGNTGYNDYYGPSPVIVTIAQKSITGAKVTLDPAQLTYDGFEQHVNVTGVTIDGLSLKEGVDYIISGNTGTNTGDYTATVTGKGNFTGTAEAVWSIAPKPITGADVTLDKPRLTYNGSAQRVNVTGVTIDGLSLTADDFTLTGNTGTNAGDYTATVTGKGNFTGTAEAVWSIGPKSITGAALTLDKTQLTYNGSAQRVSVTGVTIDGLSLTADDFTLTGNTGTNAGDYTATVTGKGNFTGTATAVWSIAPKAMTVSAENVTVPYDGQPHGITVTVTDPSAGAVVNYGTTEGTYDLDESPAITNVSESPLTVYFKVTAANYEDYTGSAVVTITEPEPERSGMDFFLLYGDCELPATGFSSLRPTVLPEQPQSLRYEPVRMHLMLPTLDRDVELVTMPREGNSWAAARLGADAGILEGSALPGEGLSVIAGHNTLNDTDYGPFALLSTLEVNDTVMVREESGALKLFRVYANELLAPDDMERLAALAGEDALVLVTCENESADGTYLNRRAVFAR